MCAILQKPACLKRRDTKAHTSGSQKMPDSDSRLSYTDYTILYKFIFDYTILYHIIQIYGRLFYSIERRYDLCHGRHLGTLGCISRAPARLHPKGRQARGPRQLGIVWYVIVEDIVMYIIIWYGIVWYNIISVNIRVSDSGSKAQYKGDTRNHGL